MRHAYDLSAAALLVLLTLQASSVASGKCRQAVYPVQYLETALQMRSMPCSSMPCSAVSIELGLTASSLEFTVNLQDVGSGMHLGRCRQRPQPLPRSRPRALLTAA